MAIEYKIQYLGDETTKQVKGSRPFAKELNAITKKVIEATASDSQNESIVKLFDFMVDPANESIKDTYRRLKQSQPQNTTVLVLDKDKNPVRRFPFILVDGEPQYKPKRVSRAGVTFNPTGKSNPDGTPEYLARCTYDQWLMLRDTRTQVGKYAMYAEIEELKDEGSGVVKSLIDNAVKQALKGSVVAKPEEKEPEIAPEPPPAVTTAETSAEVPPEKKT